MSNKFKTKNGRLTRYAFICGYIEEKNINNDNNLRMSLEPNGFHIKGFKNGKHVWIVLDKDEYGIKAARKYFDNFFKKYKCNKCKKEFDLTDKDGDYISLINDNAIMYCSTDCFYSN